MKQLALLLILMLPFEMAAQVDDMYFVPKKKDKKNKVQVEDKKNVEIVQEQRTESYTGEERDEDEYNRRGHLSSRSYNNDDYYEEEQASNEEYVSDGEDNTVVEEEDFTYSSRILRFHSPRMVMLSSPWYWDIVYTCGTDNWIVCDDGLYWDVYPSYSYYSSWYYPTWSWHFSFAPWGVYNSYCWDYWHAPFYAWHHHHHYYPHWGGNHHGHIAGATGVYDNRRPPIIDMRSGKKYTANNTRGGVTGTRNRVLRSDNNGIRVAPVENVNHRNEAQNGGNGRAVVRSGRSGNAGNNAAVNRGSNVHNNRGTVVRNRNTVNKTDNAKGKIERTRSERNRAVHNSSSQNSERTYDRPSSTRTTSRSTTTVERSSNNRNSSGSFSRGGGGSMRNSGGSIGGGSRGRRR